MEYMAQAPAEKVKSCRYYCFIVLVLWKEIKTGPLHFLMTQRSAIDQLTGTDDNCKYRMLFLIYSFVRNDFTSQKSS